MIDFEDQRIRIAVKEALDAERSAGSFDLERDLWPQMRARLDQSTVRPSIFDWTLAAAIVLITIVYPPLLLGVLYHL